MRRDHGRGWNGARVEPRQPQTHMPAWVVPALFLLCPLAGVGLAAITAHVMEMMR